MEDGKQLYIRSSRERIEIRYNGLKLNISTSKENKHWHKVEFSKLETELDGRETEKNFCTLLEDQYNLNGLDLYSSHSREKALGILHRYAEWLTPEDIHTLDSAIVRNVLHADRPAQTRASRYSENPNKQFLEKQSEDFRNIYRIMLQENIPLEAAKRRYGY